MLLVLDKKPRQLARFFVWLARAQDRRKDLLLWPNSMRTKSNRFENSGVFQNIYSSIGAPY
ncbi:MAG: hypothetical protein OER85_05360 [Gammaproteobacteria bacterium]|nr:hypothetical protein [Gammaproteobacteria bacterium]